MYGTGSAYNYMVGLDWVGLSQLDDVLRAGFPLCYFGCLRRLRLSEKLAAVSVIYQDLTERVLVEAGAPRPQKLPLGGPLLAAQAVSPDDFGLCRCWRRGPIEID